MIGGLFSIFLIPLRTTAEMTLAAMENLAPQKDLFCYLPPYKVFLRKAGVGNLSFTRLAAYVHLTMDQTHLLTAIKSLCGHKKVKTGFLMVKPDRLAPK